MSGEDAARPLRLPDLPNEVANALLIPVYDLLDEAEALDGIADEVVQQQLDMLSRTGWNLSAEVES